MRAGARKKKQRLVCVRKQTHTGPMPRALDPVFIHGRDGDFGRARAPGARARGQLVGDGPVREISAKERRIPGDVISGVKRSAGPLMDFQCLPTRCGFNNIR